MEEPITPAPRPYATPHSAPPRLTKYDPGLLPPSQDVTEAGQEVVQPQALTPNDFDAVADRVRSDPDALAEFVERVSPPQERCDGWSPFARKLFLQVLADTGKATVAADYTGLSRQSAYTLAARDPLFGAAWDAAALMARRPLDDKAREQMIDGITETIRRGDGATITRHRYDARLTIGLLNRLDKRCDRAEERGGKHLALMRHWDEFLRLIGKGDDEAARALIEPPAEEPAKLCQNCQLPESGNPIPDPFDGDPSEDCWKLGTSGMSIRAREDGVPDGTWMTSFPPPPGFDGYQNVPFDGFNWYERTCTVEEVELIESHEAAAEAEERAEIMRLAEAKRDSWFASLRRELGRDDAAADCGETAVRASAQHAGDRYCVSTTGT